VHNTIIVETIVQKNELNRITYIHKILESLKISEFFGIKQNFFLLFPTTN